MDEEKSSSAKTPKKKNLGILIMTLCIVLVVIILIIVIAVNSGNGDETTPQESTTPTASASDDVSDAPSSSENTPGSTSTVPESTSAPVTTTEPEPVDPVDPTISETVLKAPTEGKVTLNNNDTKQGNLVFVDSTHTYTQSFPGGTKTTIEEATRAGFYMLAQKYKVIDYDTYLRTEAAKAFDNLMQTFGSVSHVDYIDAFRVEAYSASRNPKNSYLLTGNAVSLLIRVGGDSTDTYGFDYSTYKFTVNGNSMTYEKWFKENCAKYGFYYAGLVGSNKNHLSGDFIYVGSIHAAGVTAAGGLDKYLDAVKAGTVTSATAADGSVWTVKYQAASTNGNTTDVEIPAGASYVVSGDNMGGFIIAYRTAE